MRRSSKRTLILASAVVGVAGYISPAPAATITWTGTTVDPGSGAATLTANGACVRLTSTGNATIPLTNGQNLYDWETTVQNWSTAGPPVNYTVGGDVVFTDNFGGGTVVRVSTANINPANITFVHDAAGPTIDTTYIFLSGAFTTG